MKAVLFDLDDTLYDRGQPFLAWARFFARERLGLHDEPAQVLAVDLLVSLDATGYCPRDVLVRQIKERFPSLTGEDEKLVAECRAGLLAHIVCVDDGAGRFLDALEYAGMPWGIVTNGSRHQRLKVQKLGLEGRTRCVITSEVFGVKKPDPTISRAAAIELGVEPADVLFVGDNPDADIVGAAKVGMQTAWLRRRREWPAELAAYPPNHAIDSLADILWLVGIPPPSTPQGAPPIPSSRIAGRCAPALATPSPSPSGGKSG